MDTNKMRDVFEVALAKQAAEDGFAKPSLRRNKNNGDYVDPFEQAAWWGWQASREAVVVGLPEAHKPAPEDDERWHNVRNSTIAACRRAIEANGVKCK
ncbi:hypothetical protein [Pseudomonas sp. ESBL1]|uniref:hypothetical protein n=1 Tax=Pseudomonas sp. ESBL1 TaxID=3077324 RepID=UPI002FCCA3FA